MITAESRVEWADWATADLAGTGRAPVVAGHRLHRCELFGDEHLGELIDIAPGVRVLAMDVDPDDPDLRVSVSLGDATGRELLAAMRRGRLWVEVGHLAVVDAAFRDLLADVEAEITASLPTVRSVSAASLILSSPGVVVPYHFDPDERMLWQLRGRRHLYVYPESLRHVVPREVQEAVFAGVDHEPLDYQPSFDVHAVHHELLPGDVVSWPHTAPHRLVNASSFGVSLSTVFDTESAARARAVQCVNRALRRHTPVRRPSARADGVRAALKQMAWRRFGQPSAGTGFEAGRTHWLVDADAERGIRWSDEPQPVRA